MNKHLVSVSTLLLALVLLAAACAAPTPTATPRPTLPPTLPPLPTLQPTVAPPTPTKAPTLPPTLVPTQAPPTATLPPPTKTPIPPPPKPAATATSPKPPAPTGSIAFHVNIKGIDSIYILNVATNVVTPFVDVGPNMDLTFGTNVRIGEFSPDNTQFAYIFTGSPKTSNVLQVLNVKTGSKISLFSSDAGGGLSSPTWSPDGSQIGFIRVSANQQLWAIDAINSNGTGGRSDIRTNKQGEQYRGGLSWSKQGLFTFAQNLNGPSDVYTMYLNGAGLVDLTNNPADDSTPVWSPDGKMIAFTSNRDGRPQIYVVNADGSGLRRVANTPSSDFSPTWSPDGNWIAFTSNRDNATNIYMMDLNGANVKRLTNTGGDHPVWSR